MPLPGSGGGGASRGSMSPTVLRTRYAMSGTDMGHVAWHTKAAFPKPLHGSGFPARVFAIIP
eukprot:2297322-Rhodomonas_salina.1